MTAKLTISTEAFERDAFVMRVCPEKGAEITLYVTQERAEIEAIALSSMLPSTSLVRLEKHSRHKACYCEGKRISVIDFNIFYNNLTPEQYQATKILCTSEHKWI